MAEPHIISALVRKRAELGGELLAIETRKRQVMASISQIDSSLAIFGYVGDAKAIAPRRKHPPRMFKRGHLRRMIYDIRRAHPELATNDAIAGAVMRRMKWDEADAGLRFSVSLKVRDIRKLIGQ
jgi:hypothetical protein